MGSVTLSFVRSVQPSGGPEWLPTLHVHPHALRRLPVLVMRNVTFGTLLLVFAATSTVVSASKIFLPKKNWEEWRHHDASCWLFLCDKVFNKPLCYRGHHWLHNLPLSREHKNLACWRILLCTIHDSKHLLRPRDITMCRVVFLWSRSILSLLLCKG